LNKYCILEYFENGFDRLTASTHKLAGYINITILEHIYFSLELVKVG